MNRSTVEKWWSDFFLLEQTR